MSYFCRNAAWGWKNKIWNYKRWTESMYAQTASSRESNIDHSAWEVLIHEQNLIKLKADFHRIRMVEIHYSQLHPSHMSLKKTWTIINNIKRTNFRISLCVSSVGGVSAKAWLKNKKTARFHDDPSTSSCKLSTGFNILSCELFFIHICHKGIGNVVYLDVFWFILQALRLYPWIREHQ